MTALTATDTGILCHCLQISALHVQDSVETAELRSVKDVMDCTGAGSGCTACHRRISSLLRREQHHSAAPAPPSTCEAR